MGNRFSKTAAQKKKGGCPLMDGREKVDMIDIIADYPDFITIDGVDQIANADGELIPVFTFAEDQKVFAFAGQVLADLFNDWKKDFDTWPELTEALKQEGGCKLRLFRKKTKNGKKEYTDYEVIE